MIRILHVIDQGADFQSRRCVEHLSRGLGDGFSADIRTLGRGGSWRGVVAAVLELRRMAAFDVIHAWGAKSLLAVAIGGRRRILFSPTEPLDEKQIRWLRAVQGYRPVEVVATTATMREKLLTRGVPADSCALVRPGVELSRVVRRPNMELRRALGFSENDRVLLAVGESTRPAAHRDALWSTGILHMLDPRWRLLLWGPGDDLGTVEAFYRGQAMTDGLYIAERRLGRKIEPEELSSAADMALVTATDPIPPLPLCIAMASSLSIVATAAPTVCELLEDGHNAVLTPPQSPRLVAQRLLELSEDPQRQWRLGDAARSDVYRYFALNQFLEGWRGAYRGEGAVAMRT